MRLPPVLIGLTILPASGTGAPDQRFAYVSRAGVLSRMRGVHRVHVGPRHAHEGPTRCKLPGELHLERKDAGHVVDDDAHGMRARLWTPSPRVRLELPFVRKSGAADGSVVERPGCR
jgi:hypothetical protein